MGYIDGFLVPVPTGRKDDYKTLAEKSWPIFKDHGALRHVECWGDDVPKGQTTDFLMAVKAEPGETVVFSWIEWPSKASRDEGMKNAMADPRMQEIDPKAMPFDGKRMVFGGFVPLLDKQNQ
jgi:uncharacterized protein YbaA (DUF1428 family)